MPAQDVPIIDAIKSLSGTDTYPRFGSRRIRILCSVMVLILASHHRMVQMKASMVNFVMNVYRWSDFVIAWKQRYGAYIVMR